VNGAGSFRDPIRSRGQCTVFAHGLNLVVLTLRVRPPWGGEPIGLPINMRRYSKRDGRSLLDLGQEMIEEVAGWLPDHSFILGCDGAYSSLAGRDLPRTHIVSRIQRNAALYEPAPPREPGQRGRPRKKGARLGTPAELGLAADDWTITDIDVRGELIERALWARPLLWYAVRPLLQIVLVVVADPDQREHDDLLFCTDLAIPPELVASLYYGRWSIEVTFRDTKQLLGGEEPQCWKAQGPERAAALSLWTYSVVWVWYLACHGADQPGERDPGTRPSAPPRSLMRWQRSAVRCGRGAFSTLPNRRRSCRKSRRCSSMPSLRPRSAIAPPFHSATGDHVELRNSTLLYSLARRRTRSLSPL
jgi:DDE superfamily endonuclease